MRPWLSVWGSGRHTGPCADVAGPVALRGRRRVILWGRYRTRQRRPAVARFASQHDMLYSADGNIDTPGYDFPLLRKGNRRGYNNVLAGRWQDLPVKEADYWYSDTGTAGPDGSGSTCVQFSIVVVHRAATMPHVSVQAKNLFTRAAESTWACTTSISDPRTSTRSSG